MTGVSSSAGALRSWIDLLLPAACLGCRHWLPGGPGGQDALLCGRCESLLNPPPPPRCPRCDYPRAAGHPEGRPCGECSEWDPGLEGARTAVLLEGPAPRLVHALKYGGWRRAALPMARAMHRRLLPDDADAVLVPVPTTGARLRVRGYNQATELAVALSRHTGLPVVEALVRKGGGPSQVALHPSQRRTNVRDAFGAPQGGGESGIRGRKVLLVDDVLTTGATAGAAARVLLAGGARSVGVLAFARALPGTLAADPGSP